MQELTAARLWTEEELNLYINILKVNVVQPAVNTFKDWIIGESVVLMSDNATVVAYIKKLLLG